MANVNLENVPVVAVSKLSEWLLEHEMEIADDDEKLAAFAPIFHYFFDRIPMSADSMPSYTWMGDSNAPELVEPG